MCAAYRDQTHRNGRAEPRSPGLRTPETGINRAGPETVSVPLARDRSYAGADPRHSRITWFRPHAEGSVMIDHRSRGGDAQEPASPADQQRPGHRSAPTPTAETHRPRTNLAPTDGSAGDVSM